MQRLELKEYNGVLEKLKANKINFEVHATNYTKRVKLTDVRQQIVFSDGHTSPHLMKLIQSIRKDAEDFEPTTDKITEKQSYQIAFYRYIDRDKNHGRMRGIKIDLSEAYWQTAKNIGLISDYTEHIFDKLIAQIPKKYRLKEGKQARLKALGSLASRKIIYTYKDGKLAGENLVFTNPKQIRDRQIYLTVCEHVSKIMNELLFEFFEHAVYYYWDCIFLRHGVDESEVLSKIKELGYGAKKEGAGTFAVDRTPEFSRLTFRDRNKKGIIEYAVNPADLEENLELET